MNAVYQAQNDNGRLWVMMSERNVDLKIDPSLFKEYSHAYYINTGVPHLVRSNAILIRETQSVLHGDRASPLECRDLGRVRGALACD